MSGLASFFAGLNPLNPEADVDMSEPTSRFEIERELLHAQIEAMDKGPERMQEAETFKAKYHIDLDLSASGTVRADARIIKNPFN
jgi:hypothetical protein